MNKKAIGFGIWIVLITFVLFSLLIVTSIKTHNQIQGTLGTAGTEQVIDGPSTLNVFFIQTMNNGIDKSIEGLAQDSFVNKSNPNCDSTSDGVNGVRIFDQNCEPNTDFIKNEIAQGVEQYFNDLSDSYSSQGYSELYQANISNPDCYFIGDNLTCLSGQQNYSGGAKTPYFAYNLSYRFIVNQSINLDEKINLSEIISLINFNPNQDPAQLPQLDKWEVTKNSEPNRPGPCYFYIDLERRIF